MSRGDSSSTWADVPLGMTALSMTASPMITTIPSALIRYLTQDRLRH